MFCTMCNGIPQVSRVVEGFYVRFFWDWLAFISGAFRWKVFAVFADDVGETSSLSPHAALLTPCPIAINAALDTVVNIRRGLMNGRQISSMEPLLFPFFSSPVDGSIKLIRPSVIMRTSSTLSRALLNQKHNNAIKLFGKVLQSFGDHAVSKVVAIGLLSSH